MSKLLVVFGATGQQGGSVVDFVLNDAELSKTYAVRGVTRDTASEAAQKLKAKGVEVVRGDADDESSLVPAMRGGHTVFSLTTTVYDEHLVERETKQGKAIADAAVQAGVEYLIWSTLPSPVRESNGKVFVESFDVKVDIEEYIRKLPIKSAFFSPGGFMENFHTFMHPQPAQDGSGAFQIFGLVKPNMKLPLIAVARDTGKYVGAILADHGKYEGQILSASTALYSIDECTAILSKATGKKVEYVQLSEEAYKKFMPPVQADVTSRMWHWNEDHGYYGSEMEAVVAKAAKQARGRLTTFEEYLEDRPIRLG